MRQKATIAVLLAALLALPASAAPTGPLPPGQPAGAEKAQLSNNETLFIGATILVIGVGLYLASGNYNIAGGGGSSGGGGTTTPPPTTTTTTTTTR